MPQDTLEQRAVLWTQALVRVPSVSGSPACLQVLETARDLIESTGVEADIRILFPEAPNPVLLARTGRGKAGVPELMLSGHVDVVPRHELGGGPPAPRPPAWKILGAPASRVTACTDAAQRT